ncbi:hypothetical protein [Bacillus massiliigorillae]|uniref:hypothetical protein n=1 Tax=Bacillus massiliigorillae TaxID=1243664 RepID=UPI0003A74F04|nr:hypothetical protein [Bacillus massiliigorillae]
MAFWNFPAVTGGNINSINNAGLETFRDNALDSLTREICQNSLDAVKEHDKPVIVEFRKFSISSEAFPGKDELVSVFQDCKDTWRGKNKKSEEFIEQALSILNRPHMEFLRISDFNTIGLKGAKDADLGSAWSSLVKEAGSSNKEDESGGSFGIGKAAPFLNSHLRTLFYSSYDEDGYKSHIGVANIMSYKKNNEITLGSGYYTNNHASRAIEGLLNLDQAFERSETGTDIFVSAFEPVEDWQKDIIHSILHNFFITVWNKRLIVRVNDFEINHKNLGELIAQLEDSEENSVLKNYYKALVSKRTSKIKYPAQKYKYNIVFNEGEAELYLMSGEDLNRRVLMTRKTGMKIFEQKNINGSISFTGILMITGTNMNSIFKQLENPAHNGWMPNRFEKDAKLADKIYSDLRKFIRTQVKELFQQKTADVMDAVGLSDFLPNNTLLSDEGKNKKESISSTIKEITYKKKEQEPKKKKRKMRELPSKLDEELMGEFGIMPEETTSVETNENSTDTEENSTEQTSNSNNNRTDKDKPGEAIGENLKPRKSKPVGSKQKYICSNKQDGKYNFLISTDKAIARGELRFKLLGEQSDYDLPIKTAKFNDGSIKPEEITNNSIFFISSAKKKSFSVSIEVDYSEYCVMEVEVFEA